MERRPWYERLLDRDSEAGPFIVLALLILAIAVVFTIGPLLDRLIQGEKPRSHVLEPAAIMLVWPDAPTQHGG